MLGPESDEHKGKPERKKTLMGVFINDNYNDQRVAEEFQEITRQLQ